MPARSQQQWKWMFATGQPFAHRWAHETPGGKGKRFDRLPKRVKRKALKDAPCMDCVLAGLKAVAEGPSAPAPRPAATAAPKPAAGGKGQQIAPGITRIRGNLCNVHGRYGPCDAALSKKPKGGKGRAARKPAGAKPKGGAGAKPKQTPEQRAQERAAQQATNRAAVDKQLKIPEDAAGALDDLRAGKPVDDDGGLVKLGLAEQAADGSYRLNAAGRALVAAREAGDAGRARDIMSSAHDRSQAHAERQQASDARHAAAEQRRADAEKKRAEAAAKKPAAGGGGGKSKKPKRAPISTHGSSGGGAKLPSGAGGGGGGGGATPKPKPEKPQAPTPERTAPSPAIPPPPPDAGGIGKPSEAKPPKASGTASGSSGGAQKPTKQPKYTDQEISALQALVSGKPADVRMLVKRGLARMSVRGKIILTAAGSRALRDQATRTKASDPGDYLVVEDRTKPTTWHLQVKKNGTPDHRLMGAAWAALHGGYRGNTYSGPNKTDAIAKLKKLYASEKMDVPSEKAFTVFKDARGQMRWLSRTTTAFEDRDNEVISQKALDESAASNAPRGPLRFWHMGKPDPLSTDHPWGPGVDLGWCDFAAMSGKTLIESGTFKSEAIANAVAAKADQLELSPGFFHAAGEPDASGVFHHIRIFERSLVPKWAGRASNPYTGLVVEKAMDQKKIEALQTLGVPEATIKELLADVATTEKAAEADGVRYKEAGIRDLFVRLIKGEQVTTKAEEPEEAPPVEETAPPTDPLAELLATVKALQEEVAALKAPMPQDGMTGGMDAEDDPALGGDSGVDEVAEGDVQDTGDGGLTLSADDLSAIGQVIGQVLQSALEPLVGALGITQKLEGHMGELKSMMAGYAKTKDDTQAQLVARLDQAEAKVTELVGDAPRNAGYRASQASDNGAAQLMAAIKEGGPEGDPSNDNPFADLTAKLFPQYAPRR